MKITNKITDRVITKQGMAIKKYIIHYRYWLLQQSWPRPNLSKSENKARLVRSERVNKRLLDWWDQWKNN